MSGTCPKCDGPVEYVTLEHISVTTPGTRWHGVSYLCPNCRTVLGVGIDPFALKADVVDEVLDGIRKLGWGPSEIIIP